MTRFFPSCRDSGRYDAEPMRPVIGVVCCNEVADRPIQAVATRFIDPLVLYANATVLLVPAVADALDSRSLAARLDGLLLTGSRSNVAGDAMAGSTQRIIRSISTAIPSRSILPRG